MTPLDIRKLNFLSKVQICWSFLWRALSVGLGSAIAGGILGGILGVGVAVVVHAIGMPNDVGRRFVTYSGAAIGGATGMVFFYIYVRWLLGSPLGRYRLVLLSADDWPVLVPTPADPGR